MRTSVQINIRATDDVAEAFREEATRRGLSLGSTLAALLTLARAGRESGTWLALPREVESALGAVAAARGCSPGSLLGQLVAGQLRRDLLRMAAALEDSAAPSGGDQPLDTQPESAQDIPEEDDEVGVFTVFD